MTVKIHGKDYMQVNERLAIFRRDFPRHALLTEIHELTEDRIVMKATIRNSEGAKIATGFAYEIMGSTNINKTSFIENCETSAWGRALANLGIGLDVSVASAEEVSGAIEQQSKSEPEATKEQFNELLKIGSEQMQMDKKAVWGFLKWEAKRTEVGSKNKKMVEDLLRPGVFEAAATEYIRESM